MAKLKDVLKIRVTRQDMAILKRIMVEFHHRTISDAVRMVFNCSGVYTDMRGKVEKERDEKEITKEPRKLNGQ